MEDRNGQAPRALDPRALARTLLSDAPRADLASGPRDAVTIAAAVRIGGSDAREAVTAPGTPAAVKSRAASPSDDDQRYARGAELGRGGMGRVEEAFDCLLGRSVARKTLLRCDEEHAAMLVAEAQVCAQLEHPSIVPLYDLGRDGQGHPCYTMRIVRGSSLRDVLSPEQAGRAALPLAQLLGIFRQVCLAVDYAHSRGVVHRDLKPENVVLGEFGEVYVVDWGIAKVMEGASVRQSIPARRIAGTPGYMAPEQVDDAGLDGRADVFALGVMLYEILSGVRPFAGDSLRSVLERRNARIHVPPSRVVPGRDGPTAFDALVLACLSPDPNGRPERARALAVAIDEFLDGERARAEREREASLYVAAGDTARAEHETLIAQAYAIENTADEALAKLPPWQDAEDKLDCWKEQTRARRLRADAARALARAETAYARALGRVPNHREAREGLARLHYGRLLEAEALDSHEQAAELLDLARAYDDGGLALELANEGELLVQSHPAGARVTVERYEAAGPRLVPGSARELGTTPSRAERLAAGSYRVIARVDEREVRYPIVVRRAQRHVLELQIPARGEVPEGMLLIPGGPFLGSANTRSRRLEPLEVPDFALARFPVRIADYVTFLQALSQEERRERWPGNIDRGEPYLVYEGGRFALGPKVLEGPGRARVTADAELALPIANVRWYDAVAYAHWLSQETGLPYRLPTDLEWEKAMRGADGRAFPTGTALDPSFAKLRESRPEPSQPEPVGAFPLDESPYGVRDLAGGLGDWTSTSIDGRPLPSFTECGSPEADERQAIWRGGTWSSTAFAQRDMRYAQPIRSCAGWIGFRLALSLEGRPSSQLLHEPMKR